MDLSIQLDFTIFNQVDPKRIYLVDLSNWGVAESKPSYLQIFPPGVEKPFNVNFVKKDFTILNSVNLGLNCVTTGCGKQEFLNLPDGVWEFCLQSGFEDINISKFYLRTDNLRIELDKLYIKSSDIQYNSENSIIKDLLKVEWLINIAHSFTRDGNIVETKRAYEEALKELEKYKVCKNCY